MIKGNFTAQQNLYSKNFFPQILYSHSEHLRIQSFFIFLYKKNMAHFLTKLVTFYAAPKQVRVKSPLLAILYFSVILMTWIAFLGSLKLDLRQVYQKTCPAHGSATAKIKGYLSTEHLPKSDFHVSNSHLYRRVWDNSDLILGEDAQDGGFIAITNLIITPNQTRGYCVEKNATVLCKSHADCSSRTGQTIPGLTNGAFTGRCFRGSCELSAWCPLEQRILPLGPDRALLSGIKDYTIMLKISVQFPECSGQRFRNILPDSTPQYLSECKYNVKNDTVCPVFRIGDVVQWSGNNFSSVALTGGLFRIESIWNCDFDWDKTCFPTYKFLRIDDSEAKRSPGLNFRISDYHEENRRTLTKVFGIKIQVEVSGIGHQFELWHFVLSLGATLGLFSVGALICDSLYELFIYLRKHNLCKNIVQEGIH